jgi:septal ring factor EnvC (AmiA/AmiB activator)
VILMRAVTPVLQQRAQAFAAQAREIERVRRQITLQNENLILTESELADRRAAIEQLAREKGALEESLDPAAREAAQKAEAAARGAADPGALVQRLETNASVPAAAPSAAPPIAGPPIAGPGAAPSDGRLAAPAAGVVVRRWGERLPDRRRSEGVAWRTQPLAEVRAPAAARVDYAGPLRGWGQVVVLRVDDHVRLVLTGLGRCDTAAGRSVAAGEPVGLMGRVRTPAPEVYLEVRRDGAPVDPMRWLDGKPGA